MREIGTGSRLAAAVAASGLLLVGLPAVYFLTAYGCGEGEDRLAEAMAHETVLDTAPDGAGRANRYQECDDDDRFVVVGRQYPHDSSPRTALRHYRKAAQADGWRPGAAAGGGTVPGCFTKSVGGTTAYLVVEGPEKGVLHVEIVADHAESERC
ncbi:hypothetical protein [Streptomyces sp. NEAU-W12]|uniref:hypothetical protein n=1 Tax=Streptomyces sp. NEAU-W12 TaxID=2994668 RepID=UPI00224B8FB2|nr:hypothetical protein [Streptomyces sp. NEAU-W12]MCX2923075.1 hypothetical protein [Streptomyces sp. NEAU-W12]